MKTHILSADGLLAIAQTLLAQPLLTFDFDGTLAPIVDQPADAFVPAAVAERLQRLAAQRAVAVITGRRIADVRPRLPFAPVHIVGNHGAEDAVQGMDAAAVECLRAVRTLLARQTRSLAEAGVWVEDKGASLALHYRGAAEPPRAVACIAQITATLDSSVRAHPGKMVVNLVAAASKDKAAALDDLLTRLHRHAAIYVGDDLNDEPVFERQEPAWLTVKIGMEQPSAARYFLQDVSELPAFIDRLLMPFASPLACLNVAVS